MLKPMIRIAGALFLAVSLVVPAVEAAGQQGAGIPALDQPLPVDAAVRMGELGNGMRYYVRENREPRARAELRLVVNAGSILEDERQRGLAHLVEHMAFNGTEHFEKQELVSYLERIGMRFGPDINAYTSFDETVYLLTVPTDSAGVVETGLQILEDWSRGVTFDSVEVEKERGVVIEEWRLGQGAGSRMQEKQFPVLLRGSRYAERLPIGTRESLESFRVEDVRRYYGSWYRPELMAVVAVGDFEAERMEGLIREQFGDLPAREGPERREYDVPDHAETFISIATDAEATAATISVNVKREPTGWTSLADYRKWIVETLASSMLTNRMSEWTQRPGSPFLDISSFQGRFLRPVAALVLSARVPPAGVERGLEELLREITRVRQHGFTRSELEREKLEMMRRIEQRYAERERMTSSGYAAEYVAHFLYGGTFISVEDEYALYARILPAVTLDMANGVVADWVRPNNRVILVNMPESDSIRPPRQSRLEALVRTVDTRRTAPYADSTSASPLMRELPLPGILAAEIVHPEVDVTEWRLGNGVRVLVKATDFREDEVLVVARSPGGRSQVPDSLFPVAVTAAAVVQAGGVGEFSQLELRKRLAGTVAGVGADISESFEGLSGAASARDVETLLQLIHLKFAAPRVDTQAVEAYRQQARATLSLRSADPDQVFADSVRATLTQNHLRAWLPSAAHFDALDIEQSFRIYRDRFADASDFTFYLVGSVSLDSLRPLVVRYLGSLPSLNRVEAPIDAGITPPPGVVIRTVHKGMEPRARTQLVFTGPLLFDRDRIFELNVVAGLLRLRLRETLREGMSGTYGVEVRPAALGEPRPRYQLAVAFGGEPARMAELTRAVFQVIDSLRTVGPTADDLVRVREMELRQRQTDLRTNRFWIEAMLSYDQNGWLLNEMLDYPEWLARVDAARAQEYVVRYVDPATYVQVTLLPEAEGTGGLSR